jgi:hypothetical protein
MLNGPCHIHYAFVDGKRVSRHAMKDCTTFLKLQEAAFNKQAEAKWQGYEGNAMELPRAKINQTRDATKMKGIFHLKGKLQH